MNLHLRQTGRTERMLMHAISLLAQGRSVYIYTHHEVFRRQLIARVQAHPRYASLEQAKFEIIPENFNWSTMQPHNRAHPNCVFLVDHAAVELELAEVDQQILRLQQLARQMYSLTT